MEGALKMKKKRERHSRLTRNYCGKKKKGGKKYEKKIAFPEDGEEHQIYKIYSDCRRKKKSMHFKSNLHISFSIHSHISNIYTYFRAKKKNNVL